MENYTQFIIELQINYCELFFCNVSLLLSFLCFFCVEVLEFSRLLKKIYSELFSTQVLSPKFTQRLEIKIAAQMTKLINHGTKKASSHTCDTFLPLCDEELSMEAKHL
jgi:hypothetical protein